MDFFNFIERRGMRQETYQQVGRKCDRASIARLVTRVLEVGQFDTCFHDGKFWKELNKIIDSVDKRDVPFSTSK